MERGMYGRKDGHYAPADMDMRVFEKKRLRNKYLHGYWQYLPYFEEYLDEIREMIRMAHEEGMAVMAHCNGAKTMEAAAEAGVDSIEHGAYSDEEALAAMFEAGVIWTPTLSPIGNLKGGGRFEDEITEQITAHHLKMVKRYADLGGSIALGSDAGAWRVPHVEGLWTELQYLRGIVEEDHLKNTEGLIKEKFFKRN